MDCRFRVNDGGTGFAKGATEARADGNPYDNAMMESFMKTLKVEGIYPMAFESADEVAEHLPRFIVSYNERRLHSALGYLSPNRFEENNSRSPVKSAA